MSMGWIESRVKACEEGLEYLKRLIQDLIPQLRAANQQLRNAGGGFGGGGGGSQGVFLCIAPSSGSWGATGTWPALTPGSFTADVYQAMGTSLDLVVSGATINNWYPATPAVSKVIEVSQDGSGAYVTVAQSCI
jgi:hypothetical protein